MSAGIDPLVLLYPLVLIFVWLIYAGIKRRRRQRNEAIWEDNLKAGLTEPVSLHPVINPSRCIGSGSCVSACPEGQVIGMMNGKAALIDPTRCIGHGACAAACPHDAIDLVFGTAKRGVDIPVLDEQFCTSVPGIYIAGELGGMGLIRNAISQGWQAITAMSISPTIMKEMRRDPDLPIVIVGAGPAGLSAALAAHAIKAPCKVLEQDTLGGTIAHYPRGKLVMTQPVSLPLVGKLNHTRVSKEDLMEFWRKTVEQFPLDIQTGQRVTDVQPHAEGGFLVSTASGLEQRAAGVLLAIGRRGLPRRLEVPGENLTKVVYRMIDPEQYQGQKVLVVGGGDSALEAAVSLSEQPGCEVTLSYRGEAFNRARSRNRDRLNAAVDSGQLQLLLNSKVESIQKTQVYVRQGHQRITLTNDSVIIAAGGLLPTPFLQQIGVQTETRYGT
ncbi:MAG: NAD(P)-binding domain-containing protein [Oceanobacter sp.]